MSTPITPPAISGTDTHGRPFTVSPLNVYRRLPAYEGMAEVDGLRVHAWAMLHEGTAGALTGAAGISDDGRPHIFIAMNHVRCALQRIGVFTHEAAHVKRGDLARAYVAPEAERACEAAAIDAVAVYASIVRAKTDVRLRPRKCVACFSDGSRPCPQGPDVFNEVQRVLALF